MRWRNRVRDTSTTTGTGTITVSGTAPTGFQAFGSAYEVGEAFQYAIVLQAGSEWEVGVGTLASSTTFTRDVVLESSNADALVNFSAGTKDVYVVAAGAIIEDIQTWVTMTGRNYV